MADERWRRGRARLEAIQAAQRQNGTSDGCGDDDGDEESETVETAGSIESDENGERYERLVNETLSEWDCQTCEQMSWLFLVAERRRRPYSICENIKQNDAFIGK